MRSDRFRSLLTARGPFASVYIDDSHDTADAEAQIELRWREIGQQLDDRVSADVVAAIERSVLGGGPAVGRSGRSIIADAVGVVLDEPLLRGAAAPVVRVSEFPYIIPVIEHGLEHPSYLVVAVDHAGADITVHCHGRTTTERVDGGGYPVHKASGAETAGYGDPQPRAEEARAKNIRATSDRVSALLDDTEAELVFVAGEVRSRSDFVAAVPARVGSRIVEVNVGARGSIDQDALAHEIATTFQLRRARTIEQAAQRFEAEIARGSGLATEGMAGVCAALRDGAAETLIIGEVGDATVVVGEGFSTIAPNAEVLSEWGRPPSGVARADEALPIVAVSVDANLVRADERIDPKEGV
ncbi:MAG TPA: hypothetical protein VE666_09830, partial [Mycobacterium sp.]|nr:hypothetical protein [Mycobacterium sp.]